MWLAACASAPPPSAESRRLAAGPKFEVSGRVLDEAGAPVAGVFVRGLPRGKDIPWMPPAETDGQGRFTLTLPAGVPYSFVLGWNGAWAVTPASDDPSALILTGLPGERLTGVTLRLDRAAFSPPASRAPGVNPRHS